MHPDDSVQRSLVLSGNFTWDRDVIAWFHNGTEHNPLEPLYSSNSRLEQGLTLAVCTYKRAKSLRRFLDSLLHQDRLPDRLLVVDASPDDETEQMVRNHQCIDRLAGCLLYFRVTGALKGLTRQRNFALRYVGTDLVAFFDDDVVLLPGSLREMEGAYRLGGDHIVGVGAFILNGSIGHRRSSLWRIKRLLGLMSSLQPGTYSRSGMSIPWGFLGLTDRVVQGDWLPGCAMMWNTDAAREVGFNELFSGYCNAEDLEFSLRMKARGKLLVAGKAQVLHLQEPGGRPEMEQMAYMNMRNAYYIHRHCLPDRTWKDGAWFIYAYGVDTIIRCAELFWPGRTLGAREYLKGRLRFFVRLPWLGH